MLNLSRRNVLSSAAVAAAALGLSKPLIFAGPAFADGRRATPDPRPKHRPTKLRRRAQASGGEALSDLRHRRPKA
jgi:hypothetical protein